MASFIDKMMRDKTLGLYFTNNKMRHCIPNKITLFFAYTKGVMEPDDMESLKDTHAKFKFSVFDYERSLVLFKEALYENGIDPILVEETINFYKTMKKDLVYIEPREERKLERG